MSSQEELAMLIAEQERDARLGDHVLSVSLDVLRQVSDRDGAVYLFPRRTDRGRRQRGLLGHRARLMTSEYRAICPDCGTRVLNRSTRCGPCARQLRQTHGNSRWRAGCRCDECRAAYLARCERERDRARTKYAHMKAQRREQRAA